MSNGMKKIERRERFLKNARKIVVKVGSNCLTTDFHIDPKKIRKLTDGITALMKKKYQVVLVTSGAVAAGTEPMKLVNKKKSLGEKQACAAVGQIILMDYYRKNFTRNKIVPAQILLTENDFTDRKRYLNIRTTIDTLLQEGILPIINENDTVAVAEIIFGDNDMLSALIANLVDADALVILTGVDGLMDMNEGIRVDYVERIDNRVYGLIDNSRSDAGRGGMNSKIQAMKTAADSGRTGIIANFDYPNVLQGCLSSRDIGTFFSPVSGNKDVVKKSRIQWLKYGTASSGRVVVDLGAVKALNAKKSLLPSGIISIEGKFERHDIIDIVDEQGGRIARGVTNYASAAIEKICKQKSSEIEKLIGYTNGPEVVHVDDLVIL